MAAIDFQREDLLSFLESSLIDDPADYNLDLTKVTSRLTELIGNGRTESAVKILQLLGTAAGAHEEWRPKFRASGILSYAAQHVDASTPQVDLKRQYLRVIGNCVVDNDENRELVTPNLLDVIACLGQEELIATAVIVMMNLCNDFEPAQEEAAQLRLDSTIAGLLATNEIPEGAVSYAIELVQWITRKLTKSQTEDDGSVQTFTRILEATLRYDEENYHDYVALATHYLQSPEFHSKVATIEILDKLVDLTLDYESRLTAGETLDVFRALATQRDSNKSPSEDLIILLLVHLVNALSAISATDTFVQNFTVQSSPCIKLRSTLQHEASTPVTVSSCVALGNLVTSDEISHTMIKEYDIHLPLISILETSREPAVLYAAAGFVRNLAVSQQNKALFARQSLIEVCCRLLVNTDPSVRGEAAAILGKLVTNNLDNVKKVVYEGIPHGVQPAQIEGTELPESPTVLFHIVTQALAPSPPVPSTSMKNAMIELGRTIISMLRCIGQADTQLNPQTIGQDMFKTPLIARPVARLVRQSFFADARSEGLLGLGLMAQSSEGAVCVIQELREDPSLLDTIKEFASSQKQEGQVGGMGLGRNFQNTLVLLGGLKNNGVGAMDMELKDEIDMVQEELGRITM